MAGRWIRLDSLVPVQNTHFEYIFKYFSSSNFICYHLLRFRGHCGDTFPVHPEAKKAEKNRGENYEARSYVLGVGNGTGNKGANLLGRITKF